MHYGFRAATVVAAFLLVLIAGCSSSNPGAPLAVVGGDTLTSKDYVEFFQRQGRAIPESQVERQELLTRLVDYRVKLKEADLNGIGKEKVVLEDIEKYRNTLAMPYLLEQTLAEPGVRTIYEQRHFVVRTQQIRIRIERDFKGRVDTMAAFLRAQAVLRNALRPDINYDSLLLEESDDIQKIYTKGNTGWISAGTNYGDFENLVFSLKVGEIGARLVRTPIGYHIVKLIDKKPNRQRVLASHILYRLDNNNPDDTAAGYAVLSLVLDSLRTGKAKFEDLARRNSQDTLSGGNGGSLGWVERGTGLEPHFEEALFELPVKGISNIVRTPYGGLHIIRLDEELLPRTFEEQKPLLRRMYQTTRFQTEYSRYIEQLRQQYGYTELPEVWKRIEAKFDSSITTSTQDWEGRFLDRERSWAIFRYRDHRAGTGDRLADKAFTVQDLMAEIREDQRLMMRKFTVASLDTISQYIADRIFLLAEARGLEQRYPDFGRIMEDYRASTCITALESLAVLTNITIADKELREYWEPRKSEFRWPDRVAISEIYLYDRGRAEALRDSLRNGASFSNLAARYSRRYALVRSGGSWGLQPVDSHDLTRLAWKLDVGSVSDVLKADIGWSVIRVDAKDPAREKSFEEVRSEVEARVRQSRFEASREEWVTKLRLKHQVRQFDEQLRNLSIPGK